MLIPPCRLLARTTPFTLFTLFMATSSSGLAFKSSKTSNPSLNPPATPHIVSLGIATIDFVATTPHFPQPDEKLRSSSLSIQGGGNAANTACAVSRCFHAKSTLITAVGNDANGNTIVNGLEEMGVQVVVERFEGSSPFSYILNTEVEGEGTRTIIHQPASGVLSSDFLQKSLKPQDFNKTSNHGKENSLLLQECTTVHFDARYPQAALTLARQCIQNDIPYSVDVERPREGLLELLSHASVVICNSNYCNDVLGICENDKEGDDSWEENITSRLRKVMQQQAPNAILAVQTLGSKGSCLVPLVSHLPTNNSDNKNEAAAAMEKLFHPFSEKDVILQGQQTHHPRVWVSRKNQALICSTFTKHNVVDTTGAGDAFIGGFLTALWTYQVALREHLETNFGVSKKNRDGVIQWNAKCWAHALRIGTRVATRKMEHVGARKGLPFGADDEFLKKEFQELLYLARER